ncbi:MAG: hypothetical protein HYX84_07835 [Chloroflexi bacterium]|nr:hypothetical protein [Chloroflexota bacterium]
MHRVDRLLHLENHLDPEAYRSAASDLGIGVSDSFCLVVSEAMKTYDLAFPQACRLLELVGCLVWAGHCPIISFGGYEAWMLKDRKQSKFTSENVIKCAYFTLVIRSEALEEKYDGGLDVFVRKYRCEYNDKITVVSGVVEEEIAQPGDDIILNRMVPTEDFFWFDAESWSRQFEQQKSEDGAMLLFEFSEYGIHWLAGSYVNGEISLVYKE